MPHSTLQRGLYLITPDDPDPARLVARTRPLLPLASCLQLRNKVMDAQALGQAGVMLRDACRAARVPIIVNDAPALAATLGADGVHLGEDDGDIAAARRLLGADALIGVSSYDDLERARSLAAQGADYIAFGAFFPSSTKPNARRAHVNLLRDSACLGLRRGEPPRADAPARPAPALLPAAERRRAPDPRSCKGPRCSRLRNT